MMRNCQDGVMEYGAAKRVAAMLGVVAMVFLMASLAVLPAGCIPAPWPDRPAEVYTAGDRQVLGYKIHSHSRIDYRQEIIDGVKQRFYFDPDAQGNFATVVDRRRLDNRNLRHLLVLVDGIGADVMTELWQEGHFRLFHRPGVMVGTFPSITDPSFGKMFSSVSSTRRLRLLKCHI